jgi:ATP-dependent Clp protease ATP-binding subunit ClpA
MAEARRLGATAVGPEHLLVGVAARGVIVVDRPLFPASGFSTLLTNVVDPDDLRRLLSAEDPEAEALAAIGISLHEVRETIEEAFGPDALSCDGRLPFRADAKRALELALRETVELRQRRIGTTELLLGLLREPSRASELLARLDIDASEVYARLRESHAQLSALLR